MKKVIYILFALLFSLAGCNKVLDVSPVDSVDADKAIKDKTGVERAIIGSYNALQAVGLYGRNMMIVGDLAADNLVWTGTMLEYGQIQNKPIPSENATIDGMWYAAYDGINRVNNILYKLPEVPGLTQDELDAYEGEALFIRALLHYNLATYFGGVPIKTLPTLDLSNIDAARNTLAEVYTQIISDLNTAKAKLPATAPTGRISSFAASALLAKVYLAKFQSGGNDADATQAISEAGNVIANGGFSLAADYSSLFNPLAPTPESIFEVVYDAQNFNRLAQYYYSRDYSGRYEIAPTPGLISSFDPADIRLTASLNYDGSLKPYGRKYNDIAGGTDRVFVMRLAEMYLVRAEALAYSNGDISAIQADINAIRSRAGLGNTTAADLASLKLAIENECRYEFAFEGHRWSDLVRTGRATVVLGIDAKYTLFPIPLSEVQTNRLMAQNPGY